MAGLEVRRLGREEQQWPGEVGRLAEPALGNTGEEPFANVPRAIAILEHPLRQRRAKHGWAERIDGDAAVAPFAAQRLGDAVDRRLRGAIAGVSGGRAQKAVRRRHQDDLAALALLVQLPPAA